MGELKTLTINGKTYEVKQAVPADSVKLLAAAWVGDGTKYSQVVELPTATNKTKVDLQPTPEQLAEFHYKTLAFVAENDYGTVTVYSVGDKPENDHTIQVTLTELTVPGKIRGNTVGTTMPRSDMAQTDPSKADYVANKPTINGVELRGDLSLPDLGVSPAVNVVTTADTNLDDYKTEGVWFFASAYKPVGVPLGVVNGWLIVKPGFNGNFVKQIWLRAGTRNHNDHQAYVRTYLYEKDAQVQWSEWRKFVTDLDLATIEKEIVTIKNILANGSGGITITDDGNGNVEIISGGTGGGSGGGVSSWNDLTDKPFGNDTVILPETTVEIDPEAGMGIIPAEFTLEVGKEYVIMYNGVEYCVSNGIVIDGGDFEDGIIIGNVGALEEGFWITGEPFAIGYVPIEYDENENPIGYAWTVIALDGSTSVTLSIAEAEKVPEKYIPSDTFLIIPKRFGDGSYLFTTKPAEILDAYAADKRIALRIGGQVDQLSSTGSKQEEVAAFFECGFVGMTTDASCVLFDGVAFTLQEGNFSRASSVCAVLSSTDGETYTLTMHAKT